DQRRDLLEIVEERYGNGATLITSQIPVDRWHDIIGEPTIADAILDRIVHNAHRLKLKGDSLRRKLAPPHIAALPLNPCAATRPPPSGRSPPPADFNRNPRPTSIGTGGRHQSECPADFIGIRTNIQFPDVFDATSAPLSSTRPTRASDPLPPGS